MMTTAKRYILGILDAIGIGADAVYHGRIAAKGRMKPRLYGIVENPDPEEYTYNAERIYQDIDGKRIYHSKEYDASVVYEIWIGGMTEEDVSQKKREFLQRLDRNIWDSNGYRISVNPLASDLNPEESELGDEVVVVLRLRFTGGVWKIKKVNLIEDFVLDGKIIRQTKEWEGAT